MARLSKFWSNYILGGISLELTYIFSSLDRNHGGYLGLRGDMEQSPWPFEEVGGAHQL